MQQCLGAVFQMLLWGILLIWTFTVQGILGQMAGAQCERTCNNTDKLVCDTTQTPNICVTRVGMACSGLPNDPCPAKANCSTQCECLIPYVENEITGLCKVLPGRVGGECLPKGKGAPCVELARCEKGLCRCYHRHALTVTTPDLKCEMPTDWLKIWQTLASWVGSLLVIGLLFFCVMERCVPSDNEED